MLLLAAAAIVVLVPVIAGIALLGGDDDADSGTGDGMGAAAASGDVRDFADIQASDVVITFDDADPSSGLLEVTTSIDVVCAVAYGPTGDYGFLATDTDMAGGGHIDHHPTMLGLEPDTTYFYRLQGVGPDGAIYVSEQMTFRTPAAGGAAAPARANLAIGAAIVDVSSEFSASFAAANAVDGSLASEWSSRGDGDDAYVTIDLGAETDVTGVGFRTREMSDGTSITTSFTVTVDGAETFGPFEAGPGLAVADVAFTGRTIRFDVETSTGGNTGAVEIEVYGAG